MNVTRKRNRNRKRRKFQPAITQGRNLKKYIDPSVIKDPQKRKLAEQKLAKQQEKLITVELVLHDGTVKQWQIEL